MKKVINLLSSAVLLFCSIFILNSCNNTDTTKTDADSISTVETTTDPVTPPVSDKLTDPEIASVAVTANQIDIDYAKNVIFHEYKTFSKSLFILKNRKIPDQTS